MNNARKMRPIPAMIPERTALETTHLPVTTLKAPLSDAARKTWFDWELRKFQCLDNDHRTAWAYLSKAAVERRVGDADKGEAMEEVDRVDGVEVGRGVDVEKIVLLITEL